MGRYDALTQIEEAPEKPTPSPAVPSTKPLRKQTDLLANQHTTTDVSQHTTQHAPPSTGQAVSPPVSPPSHSEHTLYTSFLTTKEKTKYGTYLTDESIEKISIRAIQLKRDAHQIVQEAVNQYFKKVEK